MSFAFNFEAPGELSESLPKDSDIKLNKVSDNCQENVEVVKWKPAIEIDEFFKEEIFSKLDVKYMEFGSCRLKVVDTKKLEELVMSDKELQNLLDMSQVLEAVGAYSSDLVSGSYEGGLKIWECSIDLVEYLSNQLDDTSLCVKDKTVLELGCGAGLPGLYCLKTGASEVHFQDYNEEVVKLLTCSNVRLCTQDDDTKKQCRYFAGDWSSFAEMANKKKLKYDVILTSETIYNVQSYSKLHSLFGVVLAESGVILLAAKSYYFGVGGSLDGFLEYVASMGIFSSEIVHTVSKGVSRYIVLLKRKDIEQVDSAKAKQSQQMNNEQPPDNT